MKYDRKMLSVKLALASVYAHQKTAVLQQGSDNGVLGFEILRAITAYFNRPRKRVH